MFRLPLVHTDATLYSILTAYYYESKKNEIEREEKKTIWR